MKTHTSAIAILAAILAGPFAATAADTAEARDAYVAATFAPHVEEVGPVHGENGIYAVAVTHTINAAGVVRIDKQQFSYLANSDTYAPIRTHRKNWTAPAPTPEVQVFAAPEAAIGSYDDVDNWAPTTRFFKLGGREIQLVSLTSNGQHVAFWAGAVTDIGLLTRRVNDLK